MRHRNSYTICLTLYRAARMRPTRVECQDEECQQQAPRLLHRRCFLGSSDGEFVQELDTMNSPLLNDVTRMFTARGRPGDGGRKNGK